MKEIDKTDLTGDEKKDTASEDQEKENYEKVCFLCHRTESQAGKIISLPGGISVCSDCMQ